MGQIRRFFRELLLKRREEGRYMLERKIFPALKKKKILLVGCEKYNRDYPRRLKENNLWTLDINPKAIEYGAKRHITADVVNVDEYFKKGFFDVIFLVGIFGYGVNDIKKAEVVLRKCFDILKTDGLLIIQWSDKEGRNFFDPSKLKNFGLFKRRELFGYPSGYRTKQKRVWEFLIKP